MNIRFLIAGALVMLTAHVANATVYFDSINTANPTFGKDGPISGNANALADSFTAATPNFSQIRLLLSADNPSDGGSSQVYLVADDGTGSRGVAGAPDLRVTKPLGLIADSSLAKVGSGTSVVSLFASAPAFATLNSEYWIELVPTAGSSVEWYYAAGNNGVGEIGQASYYTVNNAGSTIVPDSNTSFGGPYDLIVDTPEPAGIAILGSGLAALGYLRRRNAKNA